MKGMRRRLRWEGSACCDSVVDDDDDEREKPLWRICFCARGTFHSSNAAKVFKNQFHSHRFACIVAFEERLKRRKIDGESSRSEREFMNSSGGERVEQVATLHIIFTMVEATLLRIATIIIRESLASSNFEPMRNGAKAFKSNYIISSRSEAN